MVPLSNFKPLLLILISAAAFVGVFAQQAVEPRSIVENQLIQNLSQGQNSMAYYKMQVGMRYFTGVEHLVIKVMADSFESDPDVYISKTNKYPSSSLTAKWYCEREGSETCVIHNGEFAVGDILYIGVKCVQ